MVFYGYKANNNSQYLFMFTSFESRRRNNRKCKLLKGLLSFPENENTLMEKGKVRRSESSILTLMIIFQVKVNVYIATTQPTKQLKTTLVGVVLLSVRKPPPPPPRQD